MKLLKLSTHLDSADLMVLVLEWTEVLNCDVDGLVLKQIYSCEVIEELITIKVQEIVHA